ncbi:hypothetical protein [Yinghuangia seranimata]|uniref:hypothetical protein n=1 Tax=Yinghuangia seranimata TaxID=408067 RepID=UPI00248B0FA7|nr:hypothetical protein [Yinghuangia seranimata]MDI2131673.1 hypothetical protein [Yinghuangia seranimata]
MPNATTTTTTAVRAFPDHVPGEFETHVTFRCADAHFDALAAWGTARGTGVTHIVLDRGQSVSQPMLTLRATTTLAAARDAAAELVGAARADGFHPVRVKVEAAPWHEGVPATDAEGAELGPAHYFEHHVKLLLDTGFDAAAHAALAALVAPHAAHLSHNARRRRDDGRHERFVTQRRRAVGDRSAARALDDLVAALTRAGHRVLSVEREFVVFDDDETLDDGWIIEKRGDRAQ